MVRGKSLYRAVIPKEILQRGSGKKVLWDEAVVYDFMPALIGDQFRTDPMLCRMLLRKAPVEAPFMLGTEAYKKLGRTYLEGGDLREAMEAYRISLDSQTGFIGFVGLLEGAALLNEQEISFTNLSSDLERDLMKALWRGKRSADPQKYAEWIEGLRSDRDQWKKTNRESYKSPQYVDACLAIGEYQQALFCAQDLKSRTLVRKVRAQTPPELLDVKWLKTYIDANFPESTAGQEWDERL